MTAKEITKGLEIIKLKGDIKFYDENGYYAPKGYCFKHKELGYLAFKEDKSNYPYMPRGNKKALENILASGGLTSYDNIKWLKGA